MEPDGKLTSKQLDRVSALSSDHLLEIDEVILTCCSEKYKKIAKICSEVISDHGYKLPDVFIADRVRKFVKEGTLQYQGYLENMRYCEVKIKSGENIS
jgi:hypothetical protein